LSTALCWRPVPQEPDGNYIGASVSIKYIIAREVWDHDGSSCEDWVTVDKKLIPFLRGVMAAIATENDVWHDAQEIIELIQRHQQIQLRITN
jgi:hypothetical protein